MVSGDTQQLMAKLRAAEESAWRPLRQSDWTHASKFAAAREKPPRPWEPADGRLRKRTQRVRDEGKNAGLLDERGELTLTGRRYIRARSWPFSASDLSEALRRIKQRVKAGDYLTAIDGLKLVPEGLLAGRYKAIDCEKLLDMLRPLMLDGLVVCRSTYAGHAFYGLPAAIQADAVLGRVLDAKVEFSSSVFAVYYHELHDIGRAIVKSETTHDLAELPIPIEPLESGRSWDDCLGIEPLFGD